MSPHALIRCADSAKWIGFGAAFTLHALMLAFLLSHAPARDALRSIPPMMVQLISQESRAQPAPKAARRVDPVREPLPAAQVQTRAAPETPTLVAQSPAAAPSEAAIANESKPSAPVEARPASFATPAPSTTPPSIVPPGFNASYLDNPAPVYPPLARRLGEEGRVMLRVHVEASGLPLRIEVRTSSGSERLDQAALEAVRRWKFVPAMQGDIAVPAFVVVPISFSLKG